MKPWIYKFRSASQSFYIYDVNTSQIIAVKKAIWDVIDDFTVKSKYDIIAKWTDKYEKTQIVKAIKTLKHYQKKGYLSSHRPARMALPYESCEQLTETLNSDIGQLLLNITEQCNLRCRYCAYGGSYAYNRTHSRRNMARDIIAKALTLLVEHSQDRDFPSISFYGGEPLLALDRVRYAIEFISTLPKKKKYNFFLDTNGVLLNRNVVDFITDNDIHLQVSLDGPKNIHDKYRRSSHRKPSFDLIARNLKMLRRQNETYFKEKVAFSCTLAPAYDLEEINDFFETDELVQGNNVRCTAVNPFDTTFFEMHAEDKNPAYDKQMQKLLDNYVKARIENQEPTKFEKALFDLSLIRMHRRSLKTLSNTIPANGICIPGVRRLFVSTDGSFYPCEKVSKVYSFGNVDKGIQKDKIKKLIDEYINQSEKECIDCWGSRLCSICFAMSWKGNLFNLERKKENCRKILRSLDADLIKYASIMEKNPRAFDFVEKMSFSS